MIVNCIPPVLSVLCPQMFIDSMWEICAGRHPRRNE